MRDTANILSFDDARSSRFRTSQNRSSSSTAQTPSRSSRRASAGAQRDARASSRTDSRRGSSSRAQTADRTSRRDRAASQRLDLNAFSSRSRTADRPASDQRERAAFSDEEQTEKKGVFASAADRMRKRKRERTKARADKAFDRQFESRPSDASQNGPRAALYKGEMGASQKRATRMQRSSSGNSMQAGFARSRGKQGGEPSEKRSRKAVICLVAVALAAFVSVSLYEPAQHYYHSVREHDRLQAELAAVDARNAELEDAVAYLQTDTGIEQSARDQLGWVRENEHSVYVQGIESAGTTNSTASTAGSIVPGSVAAPETWYSPILDAIFGPE